MHGRSEEIAQGRLADNATISDKTQAGIVETGTEYYVRHPGPTPLIRVSQLNTIHLDSVVCCVKFSCDGAYLATGCDKFASIYDTSNMNLVTKLPAQYVEGRTSYVRTVSFHPGGNLVAAGGEDREIKVRVVVAHSLPPCGMTE